MTNTITPATTDNAAPVAVPRASSPARAMARAVTSNNVTHVTDGSMANTMTKKNARQAGEVAAEELAAEGTAVTARAVSQRAHIQMKTALEVARHWKAQEAETREVPPMSDSFMIRMEGVWRDAVQAARVEHQDERAGWAATLTTVEDERDGAIDETTSLQNELDQARIRIAELEKAAQQAADDAAQARNLLAGAETRAVVAEAATAAAQGVASGLREALISLELKTQDHTTIASEAGVSCTADDEGGVAVPNAGVFTDSTPATSEWPRS